MVQTNNTPSGYQKDIMIMILFVVLFSFPSSNFLHRRQTGSEMLYYFWNERVRNRLKRTFY